MGKPTGRPSTWFEGRLCSRCKTHPAKRIKSGPSQGHVAPCGECQKASSRAWLEKNPELAKEVRNASMRRARIADPQKFRDRAKRWRAENHEQAITRGRRYYVEGGRARRIQREGAHFFVRFARHLKARTGVAIQPICLWDLWKQQHGLCALTGLPLDGRGRKTVALDHIVPLCRGGNTTIENLQWTTQEANASKQGLTEESFLRLCLAVVERRGGPRTSRVSLSASPC